MAKGSDKVFDAESKSLHELFLCEGGVAGFRIPIYQRHYDWDNQNIVRLFEDILTGLHWCRDDKDSLTFLGTIIVVVEDTKEGGFDGQSLSIIDGQQRLTTLSIVGCELYQVLGPIREQLSSDTYPEEIYNWMDDEIDYIQNRLLDFAYGLLRVGGSSVPFPRIVREEVDHRAKNKKESEYRSAIAEYLDQFSLHICENRKSPFIYNPSKDSKDYKVFNENLKSIKDFCFLNEGDLAVDLPQKGDFERGGFRKLFSKLPSQNQAEVNRILSYCKNQDEKTLNIYRLLAFANYLMDSVHITIVKTQQEKYAFDIFDSLNTTGEPLTAVQTFKPQVIRFEESDKAYRGSTSERCLNMVESFIDQSTGSDDRQKRAKDLIISFALYSAGEKITRSLDEQRRFLRASFDKAKSVERKRVFVKGIRDVANFKNRFWFTKDKDIDSQLPNFHDRDLVALCLKFLKSLKTTLSIPILCRYYAAAEDNGNYEEFSKSVKALTAFVAIRRAATGGTASIDGDLRSVMSYGRRVKNSNSVPLCQGLERENEIISIPLLEDYLREWLGKSRIEITSKSGWVKKVCNLGLYSYSAPLCRFLILAAYHKARIDIDNPGMLTKERPSMETNYFTSLNWDSEEFATIEHIAPDRPQKGNGWDAKIHSHQYLRNSIGNLTLLPASENKSAANRSWTQKKKLYSAFAAGTIEEVEKIIAESAKEGFQVSKKNREMLLEKGMQLPIMKSITTVEKWSADFIVKRSKNLAELAWDELAPWLFDEK